MLADHAGAFTDPRDGDGFTAQRHAPRRDLGLVSVVMMLCAALASCRRQTVDGTGQGVDQAVDGQGSRMTPVENGNTC